MPRKFFRRLTPSRHRIVNQPFLRPVAQFLGDPNLWHLNRRSVSGGVALGLFLAFIPLPGQMLIAAVGAIAMRVNIALAVALVWTTNPLTIPPLLWLAYQVGALLTGASLDPPTGEQGAMSIGYAMSQLPVIWLPLGVGLVTLSFVSALIGFATIRLLWRLNIAAHKRRRQAQRRQRLRQARSNQRH
ncbi:DUF2062 domain-containing protein [Guyparkeria hydrothermalis]|uniref:DUF2062 domain-containing protein n=1 Tax=Guyparkeria halophila TaxID=47960 RepID=A0A6I6D4H5_9GAMM|nr:MULTISPECIES: DUF2062 domain-containing protein [Guyparkeria]MCL7751366.1 DUF2062 domain-containing protein [Guyparkeria hydrothermalis]QGT78261.1 DUF2062 domain-containing protein [Guyparkeria halophila]TKA91905.1 DUF2062 domain-containing protein [Guyparkeria sp. SB14A]